MEQAEYLYRIVSYSRALDLFSSRELHLASPRQWCDPFETLLRHRRSHGLFAQCWCKKSVSDAMWRIYSQDQRSVRLRTTRAKLAAAVSSSSTADFGLWVRDVDYKSPTKVRVTLLRLHQRLSANYSVEEAVEALFLKRDAFDHEKEVRLVVHDASVSDSSPPRSSLRLRIEPHQLIDSIMFDPRVEGGFYQSSKKHLEGAVGFQGTIGKSALYRMQQPLVVE
ncbi:MAG: DUF2971 domain-containing protein [Burkholderiales bacterium]|nr:DUF2971 domain-containing protein [Burkholderiales bacterium]